MALAMVVVVEEEKEDVDGNGEVLRHQVGVSINMFRTRDHNYTGK
jgi:hypothetical protein